MKVKVNLVGLGDNGVRMVEIDTPDIREVDALYILNEVFHQGQNDFQPQNVRSVSVGDIIELKFRVDSVGFSPVE